MIAMCLLCTKCDYVNKQLILTLFIELIDFQQIVKANRKRKFQTLYLMEFYKGLEYPKSMQNMKFSSKKYSKKLKRNL